MKIPEKESLRHAGRPERNESTNADDGVIAVYTGCSPDQPLPGARSFGALESAGSATAYPALEIPECGSRRRAGRPERNESTHADRGVVAGYAGCSTDRRVSGAGSFGALESAGVASAYPALEIPECCSRRRAGRPERNESTHADDGVVAEYAGCSPDRLVSGAGSFGALESAGGASA